jgi:hypothetical protein
MSKSIYYDGTRLLSLKDSDGNTPEIYMCTTNNSAGKTTYFGRLLMNRFKRSARKFALIQRFNYELDDIAEKFFKDIGSLFFEGDEMTSKPRAKGIYHELFLNGDPCGYAISLNSADQIKRYSHLLSDTDSMFFDEFQSETNHYCNDEINKFRAIHKAIARGHGEQSRYVPVYMCSNPITILYPYYVPMDISSRLTANVKFLRGPGWVLEQGYNETAAKALEQSGFNRAFGNDRYNAYSTQGIYLNDNSAFIEKPEGPSRYLATLKYEGKFYAIREYPEAGVLYCDNRPDQTYSNRITVTTDDHEINFVMLQTNSLFIAQLRNYFNHGCFRFKDLACKEAILKTISYY